MIITLRSYLPNPRYDGIPWNRARIREAPASTGPWTTLVMINLNPLDTDPKVPQVRNFTFDGTLTDGWYDVTFFDAQDKSAQPTDPVQNIEPDALEYTPGLAVVGSLLRARTVDGGGNELGTFSESTRPKADEVVNLIQNATRDLQNVVGTDIPDDLIPNAQALIAIRTAMFIELSYYPEQVAAQRSLYAQFKELWDDAIGTPGRPGSFVVAVEGAEEDGSVDVGQDGGGLPYFGFGDPTDMVGFDTVM